MMSAIWVMTFRKGLQEIYGGGNVEIVQFSDPTAFSVKPS